MRCRGGLGGRAWASSDESNVRVPAEVEGLHDGPLFFFLSGSPPSFPGGPLVVGVEFVGEGKALEKSIDCGFLDEKDGEDGYEKDDVRKKRGGERR